MTIFMELEAPVDPENKKWGRGVATRYLALQVQEQCYIFSIYLCMVNSKLKITKSRKQKFCQRCIRF